MPDILLYIFAVIGAAGVVVFAIIGVAKLVRKAVEWKERVDCLMRTCKEPWAYDYTYDKVIELCRDVTALWQAVEDIRKELNDETKEAGN